MASHPHDMFDDVPEELQRVGAHRAPVARRSGWITFAWAALATGVLVGGGILAFTIATGGFDFGSSSSPSAAGTSASPAPSSSVTPITDPSDIPSDSDITITILNGTTTDNLEDTAQTALDDAGWPVGTATEAESKDADTTVVYYTDAANEDIALGLVEALGVGTAEQTDEELGAPLTIVLGSDYADSVGD